MFSLLKYASKYKKQIILGPFFKFLEAVFELILPLLMAEMIDKGISHKNWSQVSKISSYMLILSILGLIAALICQYYASVASQGFGTEVRKALMKKINQFSYQEVDNFGVNGLITRITNDSNQVQLALAMFIRLVVRAPFLSIGSIIMAFSIDWQIGLIFLALLPIFCVILYFLVVKTVPLYRMVQNKLDYLNKFLAENLSGVRVVRAFARKKTEEDKFDEADETLTKTYQRVANISALLTPSVTLIMNLGIIFIFYLGGIKVNLGFLSQGQVLALINYMNQMILALIVVSQLVVIFTRAFTSADRINEVLTSDISVKNQVHTKTTSLLNQEIISFEHVDFSFEKDSGLVLSDISFSQKKGQTLGIIGTIGSGKTILTQLFARFYDTTSGCIKINGLEVKDWNLDDLRKFVVYVPQKTVLISGTIRDNLLWGKEDASDEDCMEALRLADAYEFVAKLPAGIDTEVFEGGKNFSGGQRQRLAIARALIAQPEILVLDDSLSALDYKTSLNLRNNLKKLSSTNVIISQNITNLSDAEQILVIETGRITDRGSHDYLLEHSKVYRDIYRLQVEEVSDEIK